VDEIFFLHASYWKRRVCHKRGKKGEKKKGEERGRLPFPISCRTLRERGKGKRGKKREGGVDKFNYQLLLSLQLKGAA